jgi:uncharacterized protein YmfQ (DUF2313 family)
MTELSALAAAYRDQMTALLPIGRAWSRAPGAILTSLFTAFSEEFARFHLRVEGLAREANPAAALELLDDWERVAGLPDTCLPTTGTITERQRRVLRKLTSTGGQNAGFFIELSAQLGLQIEIDQFLPMRSGFLSGAPCYAAEWVFVWRVRLLPFSEATGLTLLSERFAAGVSRAGDRLRSFSVQELECIIRRSAPAHTKVIFVYPVDPDPDMWFDFLSDFGNY